MSFGFICCNKSDFSWLKGCNTDLGCDLYYALQTVKPGGQKLHIWRQTTQMLRNKMGVNLTMPLMTELSNYTLPICFVMIW